jgi:hypothetical protein
MGKYKDDVGQIGALVRPDEVHRDVYRDPELFELEMQRLWRRAKSPSPATTTPRILPGSRW